MCFQGVVGLEEYSLSDYLEKRETSKARVFTSRDRAATIIHLHTFKHSKKRSADVRSQLWRILELNFSGAQKNSVID